METRTKNHTKNIILLAEHIKTFVITNWRFMTVNCIGCVGLYLAVKLFASFYNIIDGKLPVECYYYMCIGSLTFGMMIFYQMLKFNGMAMCWKIRNDCRTTNYSEKL